MNELWIIYTGITVLYIILLVLYFWKRSSRHENELKRFLADAKIQIELHNKSTHAKNQQKVKLVKTAMLILQQVATEMEKEFNAQYQKILDQAKTEADQIISSAKQDAKDIRDEANRSLDDYKEQRRHEIESDLVKLVMNVSKRVTNRSLSRKDHIDLIYESLEEIKSQKTKM